MHCHAAETLLLCECQVVAVAAGYDTRAYRFAADGVRFFEVDRPAASVKKQALVEKVVDPQVRVYAARTAFSSRRMYHGVLQCECIGHDRGQGCKSI
jgi:O-methyltransferase involved in polyketide biosynthesis